MSYPGFCSRRFWRLRTKRPAPPRSSSDSATCPTTSAFRSRIGPPDTTLPACSFSVDARAGRVAWNAGKRPNTAAATIATANVKTTTRVSGDGLTATATSGSTKNPRRSDVPQAEMSRAPTAPTVPSSTLSITNCWTTRTRLPPRARRIAISRWRAMPRATSKPATFAQVMSSTPATIAMSVHNGADMLAVVPECPLAAGVTFSDARRNSCLAYSD